MISVTILKDSINWLGNRLTTLELKYPRYIHSEFMTHRVLSKNSASSRAIPIHKMIESVEKDTVIPIWTENQKGMQGKIIVDINKIEKLNNKLYEFRDEVVSFVDSISDEEVHKQNANRYLEPFQHITVICTGTEWDNFFELRNHEDAQPEIHELAQKILFAMATSEPEYLEPGQWHMPFGDKMMDRLIEPEGTEKEKKEFFDYCTKVDLKISVARCARISYLTHDRVIDYKKDLELYDRLVANNPKHLSPTEHQARVPTEKELDYFYNGYEKREDRFTGDAPKIKYIKGKYVSNLVGWIQYRKLIEDETYR